MKTNKFYRDLFILAILTGIILLIPLVTMQFSEEISWTLTDFIFAGVLIFGTGFSYLWIARGRSGIIYRIANGLALVTLLLFIWTNLAVGIIGSEDNYVNILYFLVPVIGIMGGFIARFRSRGMAVTLFAMALAQLLITVIALFIIMSLWPENSVWEILVINIFFITMFVVSGLLFQRVTQN